MNKFRQRFLILLVGLSIGARAGENAAPSSHLVFDDNFEGDIVINEVRVPAAGEAMYTYYETLGWRGKAGGYAGIQAHPKAHNYIFSIWDHKSHTAPITAVHRGPGTITQKFGGEGTGLKSWNFELGWKTDTWYTLVSRCWPVGDHMHYGFWVRSGETKRWTHMITMDVAAKEAYFNGGTDAFLEDWLETGKNARTTNLRGGWKRKRDGRWHPFGSGRYSVNSWDLVEGKRSFNFRTNWNAGIGKDKDGEFYFMTAGGAETKAETANPSTHTIPREEKKPGYAPIRIKSARATIGAGGEILVSWETDPATLPQFGFVVSALEDLTAPGEGVVLRKGEAPHVREVEISAPAGIAPKGLGMRLRCSDILGNQSQDLVLRVTD